MKTILFIEDEPTLQKAVNKYLEDKYIVKSALDGEAGLETARQIKPDLILLDLILPKKDGFEVLRELKADNETKDIPIVVLTNLESTNDVEKALELGASTYLIKANYQLDEVVEKIESVLNK